ncbi:MAG: UvrB/UvrC motif-containing protein [Candidatus Omnitrophota bacterium]
MLCDVCHKNSATVHLTEIIDERIVEMHICQACAQTKANELNKHLNISGFLGSLADMVGDSPQEGLLKCPDCGLSYEDFKAKGRLGCESCYTTFRKLLLPLLKKVHSATQHTGKVPSRLDKKVSSQLKIKDLYARLKQAIQLEEYEEAAKLRDKIKESEKKKP